MHATWKTLTLWLFVVISLVVICFWLVNNYIVKSPPMPPKIISIVVEDTPPEPAPLPTVKE